MTTIARGISPAEITDVWGKVEGLVVRGLARGHGFAVDDVRQSLEDGKRQLFATWPGFECIWITEDISYPQQRVLHVFLLAGKMPPDWREILGNLEYWARSRGCTAIELRGRKGWLRRLTGYTAPAVIMRKELQ